jgi:hypothetical protein
MFPQQRHQQIVKRIDEIEADMFGLYRKLARLRLDLQSEWRVLPSDKRWSEPAQKQDEANVR